jgi:hypothetical protein
MPAIVPLVIAGVSYGIQAYQKHKAGKAAEKAGLAEQEAAEDQAKLSEYNAAVADLQAKDAVARGKQDESRIRQEGRRTIGAQRAGFASANVDVGYGSAVDVQADTAYKAEMDALTASNNAKREAWGYEVEAEDSRRRAAIQRKEGRNAALAGKEQKKQQNWGAVSTIIGGAANIYEARMAGKGK